jgi:hypothetical protein
MPIDIVPVILGVVSLLFFIGSLIRLTPDLLSEAAEDAATTKRLRG